MKTYALTRAVYRFADRSVLRRLPPAMEFRLRKHMLRLARGVFGGRIEARTVEEFTAGSRNRHRSGRMPQWAEREIRELARFEPALDALTGRRAAVGEYVIPWNTVHVGAAYADVRRQLDKAFACMVLLGASDLGNAPQWLASVPRPTLIVDVDGEPALQELAAAQHVDYLCLPHEGLNANERAALLTRLVLQLGPGSVHYARHDFLDACLQRHGLAMAAVSQVSPLDAPASRPG